MRRREGKVRCGTGYYLEQKRMGHEKERERERERGGRDGLEPRGKGGYRSGIRAWEGGNDAERKRREREKKENKVREWQGRRRKVIEDSAWVVSRVRVR